MKTFKILLSTIVLQLLIILNSRMFVASLKAGYPSKPRLIQRFEKSRKSFGDWLGPVIGQFNRAIESHLQIKIFTYDLDDIDPDDASYVYQKIFQCSNASVSIVDYSTIPKQMRRSRDPEINTLITPATKSTIHVFFFNWVGADRLEEELIPVIALQPPMRWARSVTPPLLIVLLRGKRGPGFDVQFMINFLRIVWSDYRRLDICFLPIFYDRSVPPRVVCFDETSGTLYPVKVTEPMNREIFRYDSTKLQMNGYPFVVTSTDPNEAYSNWMFRNNPFYYLFDLVPSDYVFVKLYFCKVINCTCLFGVRRSFDPKMDMYLARSRGPGDSIDLQFSKPFRMLKYTVAVPKDEDVDEMELKNLYVFLGFLCLVAATFIIVAGILRFPLPNWNAPNIWNCLLGSSLEVPANAFKQRIIYGTLVIVAFITSNELITMATDINFLGDERSVESFEDLLSYNVSIYSREPFADTQDVRIVGDMTKVFHKMIVIDDMKNCISALVERNDRICIDLELDLHFLAHETQMRLEKSFKLTDFPFYTDVETVMFRTSSPYVASFDKVIQWCLETGLIVDLPAKQYLQKRGKGVAIVYESLETESKIILVTLIAVYKIGAIISCIVFILEMLTKYRRYDRYVKRLMHQFNRNRYNTL